MVGIKVDLVMGWSYNGEGLLPTWLPSLVFRCRNHTLLPLYSISSPASAAAYNDHLLHVTPRSLGELKVNPLYGFKLAYVSFSIYLSVSEWASVWNFCFASWFKNLHNNVCRHLRKQMFTLYFLSYHYISYSVFHTSK